MQISGLLRPGSVSYDLFGSLSEICEIGAIMMTYGGARTLRRYDCDLESIRQDIEWKKKRKALYEIEQRKMLIVRGDKNKIEISFTQKGAQEILRQKIMKAYVLEEDEACVVVFDIPETHRKIRGQLGHLLDSAGFVRIQRSVWISQYDAAELLVKLFRSVGLKRGWVRVFLAKEQP